jgi:photosystem II stability/assembly factor-like uncharacterized protein
MRQGMKKSTTLLVVTVLLSAVSLLHSQPHWKIVKHFTIRYNGTGDTVLPSLATYFINKNVGFVFGGAATGSFQAYWNAGTELSSTPVLYKTTDAGLTWTTPKLPTGLGYIFAMYFVTLDHGYSAFAGSPWAASPSGGIYETIDGGDSWKKISPNGYSFTNVYASGNTIVGSPAYISPDTMVRPSFGMNGALITLDRGQTWNPLGTGTARTYVGGDKEQTIFNTQMLAGSSLFMNFTTDLGSTWQPRSSLVGKLLSTGIYVVPHSTTLYNLTFDSLIGNLECWKTSIYKSTNNGLQWSRVYHTDTSTLINAVNGSGCVLYAEHSPLDSSTAPLLIGNLGFIRSTDAGVTWKEVGGPNRIGWASTGQDYVLNCHATFHYNESCFVFSDSRYHCDSRMRNRIAVDKFRISSMRSCDSR